MAIVQCEQGHYYDDCRDEICPYCIKLSTANTFYDDPLEEQPTQYKCVLDFEDGTLTEAYGDFTDEDEKTIGIYSIKQGNLLTVGWLICVSGIEKGNSHTFYSGRNFVGRSEDMDIILNDDVAVSREKHFSIIYDPKSNKFYAVEGSGRTYINGNPLIGQRELFENDLIEVGESAYCFVPYCKEERVWI